MENYNVVTTTKDQVSAMMSEALKHIRDDNLAAQEVKIVMDYNSACAETQICRDSVAHLLESNRGGTKGIHGFIGERAQVYISNADALVKGDPALYRLIDDNGPVDYMKGKIPIQQKACQSDGRLGLEHVISHSQKYPSFTQNGGVYQIPQDFYQKYSKFIHMSPESAGKLRNEEFRQWKFVQKFSSDNPDLRIEPMVVKYNEIQAGTIEKTLDQVSEHHKEIEKQRIEKAVQGNAPTIEEFSHVCLCSAGIECITDAVLATADKVQNGTHLRDFTVEDYKDIGKQALKGAGKGAIRGAVVYTASNFTPIPAPIASAGVTAAFEISSQVSKYTKGEISGKECAANSLWSISDAAVSGFSTIAGSKLILRLFPSSFRGSSIVGGLIGNAVGTIAYSFIKRKILKAGQNAAQ